MHVAFAAPTLPKNAMLVATGGTSSRIMNRRVENMHCMKPSHIAGGMTEYAFKG